jgi:hypothetical protein
MRDANTEWRSWLQARQQPILFAFGGKWQTPEAGVLDGIRSELRGLGALVVVATGSRVFCLGPDDAPVAVPALDRRGFETLYRAIRVDPGDAADAALTLTLVDDRRSARMQGKWPGAEDPAVLVESILAWAGRSVQEMAMNAATGGVHPPTTFTRRELVVLSLIGALAVPLAGRCQVHDHVAPRGSNRPPPPGILQATLAEEDTHEGRYCTPGSFTGAVAPKAR